MQFSWQVLCENCSPQKLTIPFGRKHIRITMRHQLTTFIIHPQRCKRSLGSLWSFTPIIIRARTFKNKKFPKLTCSTASVSNHSLSGVWWKWLIHTKDGLKSVSNILKADKFEWFRIQDQAFTDESSHSYHTLKHKKWRQFLWTSQ